MRNTEFGEVEDSRGDAITSLLKGRARGRHRSPDIVPHCRDVLDKHGPRTEDLGRTGDSYVESITNVVSPRVVVEV